MKKLPLVLCGLLFYVPALFAETDVVANVQKTAVLFKDNQDQFLPVSPPSQEVYVHEVRRALPVDILNFQEYDFASQIIPVLEPVGDILMVPMYTIIIKEDPENRDRVFYNFQQRKFRRVPPAWRRKFGRYFPKATPRCFDSYGQWYFEGDDLYYAYLREFWRRPAPDGYDPYAWMLERFQVDSIDEINEFNRWIFDPAHIALKLKLVPIQFYSAYTNALAALEPPPPEVEPQEPITEPRLSVRSAEDVRVEWPEGYTDLIDVYSKTNLTEGAWELALVGAVTEGGTNLLWQDEGLLDAKVRFFVLGNGSVDTDGDLLPNTQEIYVYGTDPNLADTDGDRINDGDETHGDGAFGDADGYLTDPLRPDTASFTLPVPEMTVPDGDLSMFDPYDPPVAITTVPDGVPEVSEWTRINNPGDTMALAVEQLSAAEYGGDTRFLFFARTPDGNLISDGEFQRLEGRQAAVTLPAHFPADEMYLMWPKNEVGYGYPVGINKTEVWWIGPDIVAAGETFSVYGRNLILGEGTCHLYIDGYGWIESITANPLKADFVLPDDIPNGAYTAYAHNGKGAEYGWAVGKPLEVADALTWEAGSITAASASYSDVKAALDQAGDYYTVHIPEGTCYVEADIELPDNIWLKGAGPGKTIFEPAESWSGFALIENSRSLSSGSVTRDFRNGKISGITFSQGDGTPTPKKLVMICGIRAIIEDCVFTHEGLSSADTAGSYVFSVESSEYHTEGPDHIWIKNCTFNHGSSVFLSGRQVFYEGNTNNGMFDLGSLVLMAAQEASYTDNFGGNLDDSVTSSGYGWARGRFFVAQERINPRINVYIGNNTTRNMNPRYDPDKDPFDQVEQNAGEQILFEALKARYRSDNIIDATENTVTCSGLATDYAGHTIAIVLGRGVGQVRYIESVDTGTGKVTVKDPWNVQPDESSVVTIGLYNSHIAVYGNDLHAAAHNLDVNFPRWTASTGVSFYGGVSDSVVANNIINEVRTGLYHWGRYHEDNDLNEPLVEPAYFNIFMDNDIVSARYGITEHIDGIENGSTYLDAAVAASVWRRNTIQMATETAIATATSQADIPPYLAIYDHNNAEGNVVDLGRRESKNFVMIGNRFSATGAGFDLVNADYLPALRGNSVEAAETEGYTGHLPGGVLELPVRAVQALAPMQDVQVWNSGTAPMSWVAAEGSPWLTLTTNEDTQVEIIDEAQSITACAGLVEDENSVNRLSFAIDEENASGTAYILVAANGQYQVISVMAEAGQTRGTTLYNIVDADVIADRIRTWLLGNSDLLQRLLAKAQGEYQVVPNWEARSCWKDKKSWRAWRKFWSRRNDKADCDCWQNWDTWTAWKEWVETLSWDSWENTETCQCWMDWNEFRENRTDDISLVPWNDSVSVRHWSRFWKNSSNWSLHYCWRDWYFWDDWKAFWKESPVVYRSWDELQLAWRTYLIEDRAEKLSDRIEDWLSGQVE